MSKRTSAAGEKSAGAVNSKAQTSELTRNILTLLLLLHFFALGVAIVSNFGARGGLRMHLRKVPGVRPYLQLLNMDTAYDYRLVHGTREDWDFQCEVVSDSDEDAIQLVSQDLWPGIRLRRYLMLSHHAAVNVGDDPIESILPAALASGMLRRHGRSEGSFLFRCLGLEPLGLEDEERRPDRTFLTSTVYEADLLPAAGGWEPAKRSAVSERTQSKKKEDPHEATEDR